MDDAERGPNADHDEMRVMVWRWREGSRLEDGGWEIMDTESKEAGRAPR